MLKKEYSPTTLVLTLGDQCNARCSHCIVEGDKFKKTKISHTLIDYSINLLSDYVDQVLLYGGEPFLHQKDLLPYSIEKILDKGLTVHIGTNGFWGKNKNKLKKILLKHQKLAEEKSGKIIYAISVDKYHQEFISKEAIANIITEFKLGNYPNLGIGITTFSDEESYFQILGDIYEICKKNGLTVLERANIEDMIIYPTKKTEFIEFKEENFEIICKKLGIEVTSNENTIKGNIELGFKKGMLLGQIIKDKNYLIFLDQNKIINLNINDSPLKAGREQGENDLQFVPEGNDIKNPSEYLIVGTDGKAYMLPAQIEDRLGGIDIVGKEVGELFIEVYENYLKIIGK